VAEFVDPKKLPERKEPIPGAKPPVYSLPVYDDPGPPEEVDEFLKLIRELRRQGSVQPK
jgi:hypothetical protein